MINANNDGSKLETEVLKTSFLGIPCGQGFIEEIGHGGDDGTRAMELQLRVQGRRGQLVHFTAGSCRPSIDDSRRVA
jgi:hypothetical protein